MIPTCIDGKLTWTGGNIQKLPTAKRVDGGFLEVVWMFCLAKSRVDQSPWRHRFFLGPSGACCSGGVPYSGEVCADCRWLPRGVIQADQEHRHVRPGGPESGQRASHASHASMSGSLGIQSGVKLKSLGPKPNHSPPNARFGCVDGRPIYGGNGICGEYHPKR